MSKPVDLTGQRFERLLVLERAENTKDGKTRLLCRCDCGQSKIVLTKSLKTGATRSCGCLQKEKLAARAKHGHSRQGRPSPTYNSFHAMRQRCLDPKAKCYPTYGGANPPVIICDRWINSFENFLQDLRERPAGKTLGRFGDVGNYEPGNVSWMTPAQQIASRRPDRTRPYALKKKSAEQIAA
jgi:hypothetical protein